MNNNLEKLKLVFLSTILALHTLANAQCPTTACIPTGFFNTSISRGILNFNLGTINNTSSNAITEGTYMDFSCAFNTQLTENITYPINVTTGPNVPELITIWIDFNNDGVFSTTTEEVFSSFQQTNHFDSIYIPTGAVTNTPLRLRILSDNFVTDPCFNSSRSQVEDYTIIINPDTTPPVAEFNALNTTICGGKVNFTNTSSSLYPITYLWDFGDSTTDTLENPTHTYSTSGTFTVSLITTSIYGSDTTIKTNYISNNVSTLTPATCTPSIATSAGLGFDAGIFNFTLNTINNTTGGDTDGYIDYTCTQNTNLVIGTPYAVSITNGVNVDERVRIWIDLNNDGSFTTSELLYSDNVGKIHNGTITIPSSAVLGTELRLRVACDYNGAAIPTSCSTPTYSQTEDYSVTISVNTNAPVADFEVNRNIVCDGTVSFDDLSINAPSSWKWYFGDGDSSSLQNPTHTYISTGTYTVTLYTTNNIGTDSITKTNYITFHDTIPTSACNPITNSYCCGYGIYNVTFNTINNTTADAQNGYEDHACTIRTTITEGFSYPISITTGPSHNQTSKVWIDLNNNGVFEDSTELLFTALDQINASGNIIIPSGAQLNVPLRMRVISDYSASSFTSCFNIINGQAEDYTVIIKSNIIPPISDFDVDKTTSCDSTFIFTEQALNTPDTYFWDFGDNKTSVDPNPIHNYSTPGTYTVSLVVTNLNGIDTLTKTNYVTYSPSPGINCAPSTVNYCCQSGIRRITLNTIDNSSSDGIVGYENFSCDLVTTLKAGDSTVVYIGTSSLISEHAVIWIDLNDDGVFDNNSELVYYDLALQNHYGYVKIPRIAVYNKSLRMRVTSESSNNAIPSPCGNVSTGQHEDYAVIISEPDPLSVVKTLNNSDIKTYPNPAKNILYFDTELAIQNIEFKNQIGQVLKLNFSRTSKSVNIENLPNGLYFLTIHTTQGTLNKKIIVDGK